MDKVFFKRLLKGEIQIIMLHDKKVLRVKMSSEFVLGKVQLGKEGGKLVNEMVLD